MDALLVERLQPARCSAPFGGGRNRLPGEFAHAQPFGVLGAIPLLMGAGCGDHGEGRVGNVFGKLAVDHQLGAAAHLGEVELARIGLRKMPQEGLGVLVKVLVGIVDRIGKGGHGVVPRVPGSMATRSIAPAGAGHRADSAVGINRATKLMECQLYLRSVLPCAARWAHLTAPESQNAAGHLWQT
jgi:hypothetical protein